MMSTSRTNVLFPRLALLLVIATGLSGCSVFLFPHREVTQPAIDGRVTRDGAPVAGMPVSYQRQIRGEGCDASMPTTRTDGEGRFRIERHDRIAWWIAVVGHPHLRWGVCLHGSDGIVAGWRSFGVAEPPKAATFACDVAAPVSTSGRGEGLCLQIPQADDPVIVELARRSRVPAEELRGIVANCTLNQRNMNLCAFRDLVEVEQHLAWHVAYLSERLTDDERHALNVEQAAWAKDAEVRCNAEADDEAEGGSMRPMVFSGCLARETQARIKALDVFSPRPR